MAAAGSGGVPDDPYAAFEVDGEGDAHEDEEDEAPPFDDDDDDDDFEQPSV